MKKIYTLFLALIFAGSLMAQTPQSFKYQAVARDAGGDVVADQAVGMQISILQGSTSGTVVYVETFTPTTNEFGLMNLNIGAGTVVSGDLTTIDWSADTYFLKIEMDITGGTTYEEYGTSQLLSVPYALHAKTAANTFSGNYSDLTGTPNNVSTFTNDAGYLTPFTETDPVFGAHAANGITSTNISNWTTAYGWDDHSLAGYLTSFTETDPVFGAHAANGITSTNITNWTTAFGWGDHSIVGYLTSFTEADPIYTAWNKSIGISITASQVSDFATSVTNNTAVLANTAKVTNATHTGDVTGATALTVVGINGTSLAGLATGILKNTTSTGVPSIAVAGTDYLTPTGSAASLTNFPLLNQNTTGNAATVTTNANLTGMVTSDGNATTVVTNANLAGDVISSGNATTIANKKTMTATAPVSITGSPTVIATGAVAISIAAATTSAAGSMSAADKTKLDGLPVGITTGDIQYWNGTAWVMVPVGQPGQILQLSTSNIPVWSGNVTLAIGDSYQGGIVAYILQSGDPGYITDETHGLIVAPSDQSTGAIWGCYGTAISGADGTAIGTGNQNTIDIEAGCTTTGTAADICANLNLGGYYDWYLPSKDELNKLYLNRVAIGGFASSSCWSSTEYNNYFAWLQNFDDGIQYFSGKDGAVYVRAVRAF